MQIVPIYPPNIKEIEAVFPTVRRTHGVVFAYGDNLCNPDRIKITRPLMAHEETHCRQQAGNPDAWWRRYLSDTRFRFDQECEAHIAEYRAAVAHGNRAERRAALVQIAKRLSGPLYLRMISFTDARKLLGRGADPTWQPF